MFFNYLLLLGVVLSTLNAFNRMDVLAAHYIEHLWSEGEPKSYASTTVASIQHLFQP